MSENDLITEQEKQGEETSGTDVVPVTAAPQPEARKPISRFVHDHPVATIAGALTVGVLAAALLPRRNREVVRRKAVDWADIVSTAGLALAQQAMEKAELASDAVREQAGAAVNKAERLGESAMNQAGKLGQAAAEKAERINPFHKAEPPTIAEALAAKLKDRLRG